MRACACVRARTHVRLLPSRATGGLSRIFNVQVRASLRLENVRLENGIALATYEFGSAAVFVHNHAHVDFTNVTIANSRGGSGDRFLSGGVMFLNSIGSARFEALTIDGTVVDRTGDRNAWQPRPHPPSACAPSSTLAEMQARAPARTVFTTLSSDVHVPPPAAGPVWGGLMFVNEGAGPVAFTDLVITNTHIKGGEVKGGFFHIYSRVAIDTATVVNTTVESVVHSLDGGLWFNNVPNPWGFTSTYANIAHVNTTLIGKTSVRGGIHWFISARTILDNVSYAGTRVHSRGTSIVGGIFFVTSERQWTDSVIMNDVRVDNTTLNADDNVLGGVVYSAQMMSLANVAVSDMQITAKRSIYGGLSDQNIYRIDNVAHRGLHASFTNVSIMRMDLRGNAVGGGVVCVELGARAIFNNMAIVGTVSRARSVTGSIIRLETPGATATFTNVSISGTDTTTNGGSTFGGIAFLEQDTTTTFNEVTVINSSISSSQRVEGGVMRVADGSTATMTNVAITGTSLIAGSGNIDGGLLALLANTAVTITGAFIRGRSLILIAPRACYVHCTTPCAARASP